MSVDALVCLTNSLEPENSQFSNLKDSENWEIFTAEKLKSVNLYNTSQPNQAIFTKQHYGK